MGNYNFTHLDYLESEAIHVFREVAAEFDRPALMFSGGKDSIVMLHIAVKAFYPARLPFPLLHIDTGHNFPEALEFRDYLVKKLNANLIVGSVEQAIQDGITDESINDISRNQQQAPTLIHTIGKYKLQALFGGGRRDEEKARAKERFYSHRGIDGGWDPKNQRPELWNLYNADIAPGENMRIFPISNWTELDVWQYIKRESIELPHIYFTHEREVFKRDGQYLSVNQWDTLRPGEFVETKKVRCRTIGDMISTGMVESEAHNLDVIIAEVQNATISERGARADDKVSETAMQDRKEKGYF